MTFSAQHLDTFEAVAAVMVAQATQSAISVPKDAPIDLRNLLAFAGVLSDQPGDKPLATMEAFRYVENTQKSYGELLAELSGYPGVIPGPPKFPSIQPGSNAGPIVCCPFGLRKDLDLPLQCWHSMVLHLRSYGRPVLLLGEPHQRMDSAAFAECDILSRQSIGVKLRALASACLVVGVPNGWLWAAMAWDRPLVCLYPEDAPPDRWMWLQSPKSYRILYPPRQLQVPVLLAGLRKVVSMLPDASNPQPVPSGSL